MSPITDYSAIRAHLRREHLDRRNLLTTDQRWAKSSEIGRRLQMHPAIIAARIIFTYINFRSEVETQALVREWLAAGKTICVPLTLPAESRLAPYQITDPAHDLSPGYCRIPEPDPHSAPPINPQEIEIIIVPGSAFDLHGGRLGYGGGFYDRFITHQAPQAIKIGLAFEVQVTERLPLLPHDQRLDVLITEDRTLNFT